MKSVLIFFVTVIVIAMIGGIWWVKSTYFEAGSALISTYKDPDASMRLNVKGEDLRVYEFTPQGDASRLCIFVAGSGKGSVFCFPKEPIER